MPFQSWTNGSMRWVSNLVSQEIDDAMTSAKRCAP